MNPDPTEYWLHTAQQMQRMFEGNWTTAVHSLQAPFGLQATATVADPLPQLSFAPEKLQELQQQYLREAAELWSQSLAGKSSATDKRFKGPVWAANPVASYSAANYLLNSRTLLGLVDAMQADEKTRARLRFAVEQWLAASSPSNFLAFNVEAQQKALETRGGSIAQGLQNLLQDLGRGHVSMTDESQFEIGRNVASTEGAVVFENDLFQLIEYKALTAKVHERPFLLVPPCINKFYILDLQPDNSVIRHLVQQGQRAFVVSWRNPDATLATKTWDDYIEHGVIEAIRVTKAIGASQSINALGFCVGGTMLATALAVLAARDEQPVSSATFLTTLLDFSDVGVLDVFIDENFVKYREAEMGQGGLMKGADLASTFSFLRPNDLVWNYVVGNYLKGETPPPFDLLYWNSDSTNLPGPFYAWYLRNTYLENKLVKPGEAVVCGVPVDFGKLDLPVYIYGSRDDHIVPIGGAYASTQYLPGKKRFVMGASGHIAGVINPPAKNKRSHWIAPNNKFPATVEEWIAGAREHPGSWWPDWTAWLEAHSGKQVAAPKTYGRGKYKAIEAAPGRYVKVRA